MSDPRLHITAEQALLQQIAAGDEAAFRRLFHQWHPRLSGYLYKVTESVTLTQEIVQDVFLKIWQTRETLSSIRDFKNYLFVIARNQALNELRNLALRLHKQQRWQEEQSEDTLNQYNSAAEPSYHHLIDEAIDRLPERQREVWFLSRRERLTYQEIADQLQISRETVKTHLKLASASIAVYVKEKMALLIAIATFHHENFF